MKSSSPDYRITRIYKKFYFGGKLDQRHLTSILEKICTKHNIMSNRDWIEGLNPENIWKYTSKSQLNHYEHCIELMMSHIRLTSVKDLENLPVPRKFKN